MTRARLTFILVSLTVLSILTYRQLVLERPPRSETELFLFTGATMGTTYLVKVVPKGDYSDALDSELAERIAATLERIDALMSTYRPDSELSRFNASRSLEPFSISKETAEVFAYAEAVSRATDGALDVTVGPLVNAWGFGPEVRSDIPDDAEIDALRKRVGYEKLVLDMENNTIRKTIPDLYCDLSAVAKGYAVDRVADLLEEMDFDYFVEVGGEVRARGVDDAGRPLWTAGIERPIPDRRVVHRVVPISEGALATSGDYRNFYEENGERISHTIDPRTGRPVRHPPGSVSVLDARCAVADAYATALVVLGPEAGYALAVRLDLSALFLVVGEDGSIEERMTPAFDAIATGPHANVGPDPL